MSAWSPSLPSHTHALCEHLNGYLHVQAEQYPYGLLLLAAAVPHCALKTFFLLSLTIISSCPWVSLCFCQVVWMEEQRPVVDILVYKAFRHRHLLYEAEVNSQGI